MRIQSFLILIAINCLLGCGGGSGENPNDLPAPPSAPVTAPNIIEDITCNSSYALPLSKIYIEDKNIDLLHLHDENKTNSSNWLSPSLNSNLILELASPAQLKQLVITWKNLEFSNLFSVYVSKDQNHWEALSTNLQSGKQSIIPDLVELSTSENKWLTALYIKLELLGTELAMPSEILEIEAFGCSKDTYHKIELIDWYLSIPTDRDNNNKSDSISEITLENGYFDQRFFALTDDGGLTFSTSVSGYKTSTNTKYVRSELREMLRRGNTSYKTQGVNKNNWVFSTAPQSDLDNAGGIDGQLTADVAINHVTTTGENYQIGRVIIGQIHANDDEPIRLYYRKLPNNINGSIYIAHELKGGDDIYYEIIGERSNNANNPEDGIALNEKFSYSITVEGNQLSTLITKSNGAEFSQIIDMSESGYDSGGQYQYFKAGVYNQNNSGDQHDYVKATFYKIENSHSGYSH